MHIAENLISAAKNAQLAQVNAILKFSLVETIKPSLTEALSWAAHNGCVAVAEVLLQFDKKLHGQESRHLVNAQDPHKNTALHWARYNGHTTMIQLLIDYGADETLENINALTPLQFARSSTNADARALAEKDENSRPLTLTLF